ncbi:beta-fructofuranosidase, insoluble isoenzyme CWINV6 [Arachis ipaensis]|uniref:Uncharacterized protein n=2 Tax=Arachis hypogaea TaxID=3818 RepID=A0A445CX30_ARAHY|nr:beta-fructofuranosidase, insoluble isoenzyme CWINV6 [Arachis ipaensis]XP_025660028.1 beta-fructofuranosidase, insoluble isoenzyme CWINV6 [Arachis hypogaea]RYR55479.1 hypothetical protein Ahy_A06g030689 [Arachis hypogaea]
MEPNSSENASSNIISNGIKNNKMIHENHLYRTSYHFQPQQNWMNDPNGPMYYKGVYHLFYQYNPDGATFGKKMVWGHSVSYDLINWIHLNHPSLQPSHHYDIHGCFSGSTTIIPSNNQPFIFYTGFDETKHQVQNLAMPKNPQDPFLREWIKHPQNPIITAPIGLVEQENFRDPTTAWKGSDGKWRVIVGARNGDIGKAILYHSDDFVNWKLSPNNHEFYVIDGIGMCECPDFFPVLIDGTKHGVDLDYSSVQDSNDVIRHVLKISYQNKQQEYYLVGKYVCDEDKFVAENKITGTSLDLKLDHGEFYASKSFFDYAKKRRVLWGWVKELDTEQDDILKGWAGLQAIPRQVWLHENGKWLMQWPIEKLETLRDSDNQVSIFAHKLVFGSTLQVSGITASQADVEVVFELPELESAEWLDSKEVDPQIVCSDKEYASRSGIIGPFGLLALASKDLTEQTAIFFTIFRTPNGFSCLMCTDLTRSSLRQDVHKTTYATIFAIDSNLKAISLRTLIDGSIIESFGEKGRVCITNRVYPLLATEKDAHLYVFNNGKQNVCISKLNAWSMKRAKFVQQ